MICAASEHGRVGSDGLREITRGEGGRTRRYSSSWRLSLTSLLLAQVLMLSRSRCSFLISFFKSLSYFSFWLWVVAEYTCSPYVAATGRGTPACQRLPHQARKAKHGGAAARSPRFSPSECRSVNNNHARGTVAPVAALRGTGVLNTRGGATASVLAPPRTHPVPDIVEHLYTFLHLLNRAVNLRCKCRWRHTHPTSVSRGARRADRLPVNERGRQVMGSGTHLAAF